MTELVYFQKSPRTTKKYVAVFRNPKKTIHFGAKNYEDFTIHNDPNRKKLYLSRHGKEDWTKPLTAGTLSRYVLWNKQSLEDSLDDYLSKFKIKDMRQNKIIN